MSSPSLKSLVDSRHVLVCAGAGGVGKTTIAAAVAIGAARRGRRVLCLTIDPAKRLADALGLSPLESTPQPVDLKQFGDGSSPEGSLSVLMLDTKSTFDDLVRKHSPNPEVRERILKNQLYAYVSTSLAGTQSYMAMEKVLAVKNDRAFDLIVLDTPPTSDALDFLNAPERLVEALDSPAMRWLVQAFSNSGKFSLNVLARGVAALLRSVGKLTGQGLLRNMAEFVSELNDLFGGFKDRARQVSEAFRGSEFAYVIVTTPANQALGEATFFASRLVELGMRGDALVINRVHRTSNEIPDLEAIGAELRKRGVPALLASSVLAAHVEESAQGKLDRETLERFWLRLRASLGAATPSGVEVPVMGGDVHELATLGKIAGVLV